MTQPALPREELRGLFLFEHLSDAQLDWIEQNAVREEFKADSVVIREGDPATCFYVLLNGALRMTRVVAGAEVEMKRSDQRGSYCGATQFLAYQDSEATYGATIYAVSDLTFLTLPAAEFAVEFRQWFPMAAHLLEGMYLGWRHTDALVSSRRRLVALGELSAGLMHELNNPAAAAVRATAALRERVAGMRHKLAILAKKDIDPDLLELLLDVQERLVKQVGDAPKLSAMQQADREDEIGDWFDDHGIDQGWDLASIFVAAGLTPTNLDHVLESVGEGLLDGAIRWLAYALETEMLMGEIEDSTSRVSTLVGAAKQYSQMDRAPHQFIDVHEGLNSTLVMMSGKLGEGIRVVKEYDCSIDRVPAYAAELNQVWTNIIDNAVGAMGGEGTLTLRTWQVGKQVRVEIGDTGPGIPEEVRQRIFEPFFTTKGVGEGTGLGLDISWRIVVERHSGDIKVTSEPGDTRFEVCLPVEEQASL
ncbi:cyclic nucleotide-binding domain-containing protein [Amycolatopsis rubida]|uniref:histidine kinase n=1 Tax=Amycolatopsis rubida TaxID=112413 RepID=A0ABX0BYG8_9PSEU|nr:ATP-binding protein [Amycolatopsis sp. M39]MYW92864.1 cyclic nucleotide-binding domain-containing protein [Amycolatopsis rubida]NEC57850.1 cyclic nucleotide-binding domain-containing protein [Amycolatopsis rubida]OAP21213.1 Nitrogen regulation protein NR(II) [Amycolatopsis sp. M39]